MLWKSPSDTWHNSCLFYPFQVEGLMMAEVRRFIHSLAFANPQQQEQLLQRVPMSHRAQVLMRAQQIRQQSQQQQQQTVQGVQQPQQQARPMVVWNGIMELTEVVRKF